MGERIPGNPGFMKEPQPTIDTAEVFEHISETKAMIEDTEGYIGELEDLISDHEGLPEEFVQARKSEIASARSNLELYKQSLQDYQKLYDKLYTSRSGGRLPN